MTGSGTWGNLRTHGRAKADIGSSGRGIKDLCPIRSSRGVNHLHDARGVGKSEKNPIAPHALARPGRRCPRSSSGRQRTATTTEGDAAQATVLSGSPVQGGASMVTSGRSGEWQEVFVLSGRGGTSLLSCQMGR